MEQKLSRVVTITVAVCVFVVFENSSCNGFCHTSDAIRALDVNHLLFACWRFCGTIPYHTGIMCCKNFNTKRCTCVVVVVVAVVVVAAANRTTGIDTRLQEYCTTEINTILYL